MKKILTACFIILVGLFSYSSFAQEEASFIGMTNTSDVNVRAGANINFEVITKINKGKLVEVLGKNFNWYKIKLPGNLSCFVNKGYVFLESQNFGRITTNRVNLRIKPNTNSTILGQLNKEDKVIILGKKNDWYEIEMPQSCFGWVNTKYISFYAKKGTIKLSEVKASTEKSADKLILKNQEMLPVATGVIKSCGIFFRRPGTHKLIKEGKITYFLAGDKSLLNSFVNFKVKVWGRVVNLPNQKVPLIDVEKIEPEE